MATTSVEKGFTLLVDITIYSDKVDEFLEAFEPMLREITNKEGFLSIEVFRSEERPNHIYWLENWSTSMSWFNDVRSCARL
jgi:quinol monooxygenase YgiN